MRKRNGIGVFCSRGTEYYGATQNRDLKTSHCDHHGDSETNLQITKGQYMKESWTWPNLKQDFVTEFTLISKIFILFTCKKEWLNVVLAKHQFKAQKFFVAHRVTLKLESSFFKISIQLKSLKNPKRCIFRSQKTPRKISLRPHITPKRLNLISGA